MASKSKKKQELTYGQLPLPQSGKAYKMVKKSWNGLNYRQTIDTGELSVEKNISTAEAPYLIPSEVWERNTRLTNNKQTPIDLFGFDNFLVAIYRNGTGNGGGLYIKYLITGGENAGEEYEGNLSDASITPDDNCLRSIVQFNAYTSNGVNADAVVGEYTKKLLIFPDCVAMDFEIEDGFKELDSFGETVDFEIKTLGSVFPKLKYATVHLSRLFGVDDVRVYASGFNDYANWNIDTADEYNEGDAWISPAQSNTKADGEFTGITTFQGHVICFKKDFMHEIYNTKNPFRIYDIYNEGTIDNRTIQEVDGRLIFVSDDNVKIYTGSNPRIISHNLNVGKYEYAVSGTDGRNYYLYCAADGTERLFTYDTVYDLWAEQTAPSPVISFAHNSDGMYALCTDGYIYKMDTGDYSHEWSFETDLVTNETVDIKHLRKLQMFSFLAEGAELRVYALYDDEKFSEGSHLLYDSKGKSGQLAIRVKPRQTASYGIKLHIEGSGYARLYELELVFEEGGGLYG